MTPEQERAAVVDWGAGVKRTADLTPERLEASAIFADQKAIDWECIPKIAQEWRDTAESLRAKADDLRGEHLKEPQT